MALVWNVGFTGTPSEQDIRGATLIVEKENDRRLTDLDENGDPILPPLPYSNGAELKSSYESMLAEIVTKAHTSYVEQADKLSLNEDARALWIAATDAQRAAAIVALGG